MPKQKRPQVTAIGQRGLHELAVMHGRRVPGGQVIENNDSVTGPGQGLNHVTAYVAGAAGHHHGTHCHSLFSAPGSLLGQPGSDPPPLRFYRVFGCFLYSLEK